MDVDARGAARAGRAAGARGAARAGRAAPARGAAAAGGAAPARGAAGARGWRLGAASPGSATGRGRARAAHPRRGSAGALAGGAVPARARRAAGASRIAHAVGAWRGAAAGERGRARGHGEGEARHEELTVLASHWHPPRAGKARAGSGSAGRCTRPAGACSRKKARAALHRARDRRYRPSLRRLAMDKQKASDFDQELLNLFDRYVHGDIDRRGFLDGAASFAVGGVTAAMLLDALNPRSPQAQQVRQGRQAPASRVVRVPVAAGLRARCAATWRKPAGRQGQAAGGAGGAREPRAQPAHRGHRPPARARELHRLRARRARAARRLPRRRGQGAGAVRQARSDQDARGLRGGGRLPEEAPRRAPARSAWSASATAAASPTCSPRGCRIWRRRCPSTAASRQGEDVPRRSRRRCSIHYAENDERINAGVAAPTRPR